MKKLFLSALCLFIVIGAFAQRDSTQKKTKREIRKERIDAMSRLEEEGIITNKKSTVFGLKLTTDGYGGFIEIGRAKSVKNAWLFQLDIAERKHEKEEKQQGPFGTTAPIIYGKINYFYPVKVGVQYQQILGNKGNKNGVSVTGNLGGGVVAGLLRPYLLDVDKLGERKFVGYESTDSLYFLSGPYYGGPSLATGWNKLKVTPGIYLKPAVRFDYGKYNEVVSAVEIGLTAEFYAKKIPQMIYADQKQFFFGAYASILFGKRK